ncbi:uncharacterized protein [Fopius arisanus]|uniref:Uncharacterized protein n=1 Tax=Fopius arisanus TaxID=64838 RepID=A0A9R1TQ25_9HYME|nr:PREDICTED: uncharacterized protein LOC105272755 [Fopius arisanus]
MLLKSPPDQLGESRFSALACLHRLLRRLSRDEEYQQLYSSFLKEYEEMDHMRPACGRLIMSDHNRQLTVGCSASEMTLAYGTSLPGGLKVSGGRHPSQAHAHSEYFFPHHGVLRASSETTKLRLVFNGSNRTSSGKSLNDITHPGAKLEQDISDVLLYSRKFKLIFMTDITKMFRQIRVHPEDWPLQQILWTDSHGNIIPYQLTTVTYSTRSAPFLSARVLLQLVENEVSHYPLAVESLTKGRYVDDICGGADSHEQLLLIAHQVTQLCASGCFPLAKWHSNSSALLTSLSPESTSDDQRPIENSLTNILGVSWHPYTDQFKFSSAQLETSSITKRIILSDTAQLFDPLGFLAPLVVRAKILLQSLWIEKLGSDEPVSPTTAQRWRQFREELSQLSEVTIPRWLGLLTDSTKVAPLKRLTIPRLELTAALLLAKLASYVKEQLKLTNSSTFLWTSPSVTLTWISSHSSRWKEFVKNRGLLIQELTQQAHWRVVPGRENPADCASRGLSATQLIAHKLCWTGPSWLHQDSPSWPTHVLETDIAADLEGRPGVLFHARAQHIALWDLIDRFSSFNRLIRETAICRRFIALLRRTPNSSLQNPLNLGDLEEARIFWIKLTQAAHFKDQLRTISRGERFRRSHPLTKLTPFIDRQGILKVGGKLKFAHLGPESRNRTIIPRELRLAQRLIGQAHIQTLHGGTQLTLRHLRSTYWILGGRAPVRSFILKCVKCTRQRRVRGQQLMGQLPPTLESTTPAQYRYAHGRDGDTNHTRAGWQFSSAWPPQQCISSDCGTTFLGADKELKKLFSSGTAQSRQLAQLLINDGTQWSFNPPGAPHFGGKWEAAVKSVKFHLNRTLGEDLLTFEELTTLLSQIEAVLNSRPLEPLTDDPDHCSALTPGHFLIGHAPTTLPEPSLEPLNVSRSSRWPLIQQKLQGFWKRWSTGYLQRLQAISKWHHPNHQVGIGSLVLLTDERFPPSKWPLARVTALHPGTDGLTRVVTIKTAQTTLTRPVAKLVILPVSPPED